MNVPRTSLVTAATLLTGFTVATFAGAATSRDPGQVAYQRACAACHLPNLAGSGPSPSLEGEEFRGRWRDLTGADLLKRIATTMPPGGRKRDRAEYRLITAYILKANGIGDGVRGASDEAALAALTIK